MKHHIWSIQDRKKSKVGKDTLHQPGCQTLLAAPTHDNSIVLIIHIFFSNLGPSISWTFLSETTLPPPFSLLNKIKNLDAIDKKNRERN